MTVGTQEALRAVLEQTQHARQERLVLTITQPLAAQINRGRLVQLLAMQLPMVQGHSQRIRRERDGSWYLNAALRYRDGLRLQEGRNLSFREQEMLERARHLAGEMREEYPDDGDCARALMHKVHAMAPYANPPQGSREHREAVSALTVLQGEAANCQGFSDCFFLLASLAGLHADYQAGYKGREMHLYNRVLIGEKWIRVDATADEMDDTAGG